MTAPWRREEAIAAVLRFYEEHGRLPVDKEWEKAEPGRPAARTIRRRWGWHQLLADALEIEPERVPVDQQAKITDEQVKLEVADWYRLFGTLPTMREWSRAGPGQLRITGAPFGERPAARTIQQRWGWHQLLADAVDIPVGEVPKLQRRRPTAVPKWTEGRMLEILIEARRVLGHWPSVREWRELGRKPGQTIYHQRFGSWSRAVALARAEYERRETARQSGGAGARDAGAGRDRLTDVQDPTVDPVYHDQLVAGASSWPRSDEQRLPDRLVSAERELRGLRRLLARLRAGERSQRS